MTKRKPRTQAQLDEATDRRLKKTYGVGLAWYDEQLDKQGGGCAICEGKPGNRRLHVDHDHSWKKIPIEFEYNTNSVFNGLSAQAFYNGVYYKATIASKKSAARNDVKKQLLRASVRGLLCYSHNAGLQKYQDSPDLLRNAAAYLERHQKGPK